MNYFLLRRLYAEFIKKTYRCYRSSPYNTHTKYHVLFKVHGAINQLKYEGETMNFSKEQIAEIDILVHYNLETTQQGLKVHSSAGEEHIDAVERLFEKGLVTQIDGGYLTDLGRSAAEHAQALILILAPHNTAS